MRLSVKRLEQLKTVTDDNAMWINSSWTAWPNGEHPKWVLDQFGVARELVRLALIGAKHEQR